jgi:2-keto-3-deoxy-L-rhamnonate aldolase RhmA
VGIGRAQGYGPEFAEYVRTANARTCVVVQIEHIQAVERVEEIVTTPGVDAALIGPFDLSNSMGKPGQVSDPQVQAAIARVRSTCAAHGLPVGIFTTSPEVGRRALAEGYAFVGVGVDVMLLAEAARGVVSQVKA